MAGELLEPSAFRDELHARLPRFRTIRLDLVELDAEDHLALFDLGALRLQPRRHVFQLPDAFRGGPGIGERMLELLLSLGCGIELRAERFQRVRRMILDDSADLGGRHRLGEFRQADLLGRVQLAVAPFALELRAKARPESAFRFLAHRSVNT
ncbi:MAG: hypothetical protein ACRDL2_17695 [Gaiellaceae bacterium]